MTTKLLSELTLRAASPHDSEQIAQLHTLSWRTAYRDALSEAYLAHDVEVDRQTLWQARFQTPAANQLVLVAVSDEYIVGFACTFLSADQRWGALLDNIHVNPDMRGRGIGAPLLEEVAVQAYSTSPTDGLHLWVLQSNLQAQGFYATHGGTKVEPDAWSAPDGSLVPRDRFAWAREELATSFNLGGNGDRSRLAVS